MKRMFQLYAVSFGCVGTIAAFVWHIAAILGYSVLPSNLKVMLAILIPLSIAYLITLHRTPGYIAWAPLIVITAKRIRIARLVLASAAINFIAYVSILLIASHQKDMGLAARVIPMILTSMIMLGTIYVAIHWIVRPENIFSCNILRIISDPLYHLLLWRIIGDKKHRKNQKRQNLIDTSANRGKVEGRGWTERDR